MSFILSLNVVIYGFAVPMRGSWADAILMAGAFLFFVSSVLHVFSVFCPTRVLALQSPMVYIMPGLLYSGLSWPAFDMSDVASAIFALRVRFLGGKGEKRDESIPARPEA